MADSRKKTKPAPRLAGRALRLVTNLIETPGTGGLLYGVVSRQLGLDQLQAAKIPPEVPPYTPLHLHPAPGGGADDDR